MGIATSRILHVPEPSEAPGLAQPWVWPLPRLDGHPPRVGPIVTERDDVELGYVERSQSPNHVPVFAAHDGLVAYASSNEGDSVLQLDHRGGWSTQYADLAHLLISPTDRFHPRRKARVCAGDVIGHARSDALWIRFGVWRLVDGVWHTVDVPELMHQWVMLPWFSDLPYALPARNGGHRPTDGSSYTVQVLPHTRRAPHR